ncbi:hypothetical protein AYL99_12097 [Fonsecaea erecta]|uniref:Transaldolase n=1 Tax=Fonsecaea erecta TaxID=1367422 RepID=A0A178Z3Q9_9EURO|nr:hypothetical protein AYL99_12097 [Fonsecaea erecta]OAP53725.1 hypothetical protein AYL99_12097 [Fonsecaea erecta]
MTTWLDHISQKMHLDIDWADVETVKTLPAVPYDQTCNPYLLGLQLGTEANAALLAETVKELHAQGWLAIYTRMAAAILQKSLAFIKGRVLVQTIPSAAYNVEQTLVHARLYAQEFERAGVPRNRFCIKILATGQGVNAARRLQSEGISTLGTGVFGLDQAVACSQAGCLFISPYYNEVRSIRDPSLWPNVADPTTQHPFSRTLVQMIGIYEHLQNTTGKRQPMIKLAAFRSIKEVDAAARLGCHSSTVTPAVFNELGATKFEGKPYGEPLTAIFPDLVLPTSLNEIDYLAEDGAKLNAALEVDTVAGDRLKDAMERFLTAEATSKELIEGAIKASTK